jgi:hypothetical protein
VGKGDDPRRVFFQELTVWIGETTGRGRRVPPTVSRSGEKLGPSTSTWDRWRNPPYGMGTAGLTQVLDNCLEFAGVEPAKRAVIRSHWHAKWDEAKESARVARTPTPEATPAGATGPASLSGRSDARSDQPLILSLGDPRITRERFGRKAAVLSDILRDRLAPVPEGWCIAVDHDGYAPGELVKSIDFIWQKVGNLGSPLITRSSALVEDKPDALFAGRFYSEQNIRTRDELRAAFGAVRAAEDDIAVRDYVANRDLPDVPARMAMIVQQQLQAEFAGTAITEPERHPEFQVYTELRRGPSAPLLAGDELPSAFGLNLNDKSKVEVRRLSGPQYPRDVTQFLPLVHETVTRIVEAAGAKQQVEWVWDGSMLWVVQAREWSPPPLLAEGAPRRVDVAGDSSSPVLKSLPNSKEWGLKGAATDYFRRDDYFQTPPHTGIRNCTLILPHDDDDTIERKLANHVEGPDGTTIRFSYRAEVGVPRKFVPAGSSFVQTFLKMREGHPEWMGIVSDYLYIQSSFEAYLSSDSLLVEHVPGNWETDTQLPPDIFLFTRNHAEFYRVNRNRLAKFEAPAGGAMHTTYEDDVPPLTLEIAEEWAERFVADFKRLELKLQRDLPLNVHFISDLDGNFYFLNIRPTRKVDVSSFRDASTGYKSNMMWRVRTSEDVKGWNGAARIMVDSAADRGDEERIAGIARTLRDAGVTAVYCRFGVLSHPAIVLREFGLDVRPLNEEHEVLPLDGAQW